MGIANIRQSCILRTQMFSLTVREQILIAAVLCTVVAGALIHHWRTPSSDVIDKTFVAP
jgi:hypothetical protein